MKKGKVIAAVLVMMLALCKLSMAQGPGGPPPGPGGGTGGPIDGGVIMLVIGAAAYGYTKLKENKKNNGEINEIG